MKNKNKTKQKPTPEHNKRNAIIKINVNLTKNNKLNRMKILYINNYFKIKIKFHQPVSVTMVYLVFRFL